MQQLTYPRLLILDELGYLPLTREKASLFFRLLLMRCYERGSLIVTSNKSFTDWARSSTTQVLATAMADLHRNLHRPCRNAGLESAWQNLRCALTGHAGVAIRVLAGLRVQLNHGLSAPMTLRPRCQRPPSL